MTRHLVQLAELSIDQLQIDPDNPRMKVEGRYIIIDGHRRYLCAKKLEMKTVPCRIYPKLQPAELALRRFEVQNNRVEWGPLERAEAFAQIKRAEGFDKDKDLAGYLGLSPTMVSSSLKLLNQHTRYKDLFEAHELKETYAIEFSRIRDFLRDVREFDIPKIIEILLLKAKHKVIKNGKSFRMIGKIFLKANRYEDQLHEFLQDPDMTLEELKEQTGETWLATMLERVQQALAKRYSSGKDLTAEEEAHRAELQDFLTSIDPRRSASAHPKHEHVMKESMETLLAASA
ncbi:ParB N-terminal domain-containing protein [Candidatus Peregrinibacteria bacterium]|nr:ParB N-terminal domain-containing protein [Candidatus Peregrinibacteria bacterium]